MRDKLKLLKVRNPLLLLDSKGNPNRFFFSIFHLFLLAQLMQSFFPHLKGVGLISIENMSSLRVILFLVWQRLLCLRDAGQHFLLL